MRLSRENSRVRWLVLVAVWAIVGTVAILHSRTVRDYLVVVGQLGLRGAEAPVTPLQQAYPAFAADAQTWVRHALSLAEGEQVRLRYTRIDNAPAGREVHWNSAWGWVIALSGYVEHWVTGTPLPLALERVIVWLNALALLALIAVVSTWVARRAGALAGAILAIGIIGHPRVYEGFFPGYVDHHGLLTMAALAMAVGAVFTGAGWWRSGTDDPVRLLPNSPEMARQAAVFSAISGGCGMWVSAASAIVPIGIAGVSGVAALLLWGRRARREGLSFDAEVWRVWGRVGAGTSFFCYLLEYFPNHLGLRLEANHPFYSLAWLGAGEIIAQIGERWLDRRLDAGRARNRRLGLALAAVAVAPLTIVIGRTSVFVVSDPFLSQLHKEHIQEFLSLWLTVRGLGWGAIVSLVGLENIPLLAGIGYVAFRLRHASLLVGYATIGAVLSTGMAWIQARWLLNASGFQVALGLVLIAVATRQLRPSLRWAVGLGAVCLTYGPYPINRVLDGRAEVAARRVGPKDANSALFRDIAQVIRASQPEGEIVLLTSPNSSTGVGYYGRFKTLGTLYWENNDGLKAAAAILSAKSEAEAAELVRAHRVTHIAMISEENFVEPYFRLFRPDAKPDDFKKCFGHQLLFDRVIPPWLQMIPYNPPEDLKALNVSALLFKVAFNQTPADALYHIALAKVAMGSLPEAERDFDTLIQGSPESYQPYLRKGELLLLRREFVAATDFTLQGIRLAPAEARLNMYANAGSTLFRGKQHAQAARVYETALAETANAQIAAFLAYVLATSSDDSVRNGPRALTLAEKALKVDPNSPTALNACAAALAENERFAEAAAMADRALAVARAANDTGAARVSEARLAAFKAGKKLRE